MTTNETPRNLFVVLVNGLPMMHGPIKGETGPTADDRRSAEDMAAVYRKINRRAVVTVEWIIR